MWPYIVKAFDLCNKITHSDNITDLLESSKGSISSMSMVNYPYETSFMNPMPPWPVKFTCESILNNITKTDDDMTKYIDVISMAAQVNYNYSGKHQGCFNITHEEPSGIPHSGWTVQLCNELPMPQSENGVTDMFLPNYYNKDQIIKEC